MSEHSKQPDEKIALRLIDSRHVGLGRFRRCHTSKVGRTFAKYAAKRASIEFCSAGTGLEIADEQVEGSASDCIYHGVWYADSS